MVQPAAAGDSLPQAEPLVLETWTVLQRIQESLEALGAQGQALNDLLASTIEQGKIYSVAPLTLTDPAGLLFTFPSPLFSITVTNDGPGNIDARLVFGRAFEPLRVQAGETASFSFRTGRIDQILLVPLAGANPVIRLFGTY